MDGKITQVYSDEIIYGGESDDDDVTNAFGKLNFKDKGDKHVSQDGTKDDEATDDYTPDFVLKKMYFISHK